MINRDFVAPNHEETFDEYLKKMGVKKDDVFNMDGSLKKNQSQSQSTF